MMYRAQLCTADEERIVTDMEKCHFVTVFRECDLGQKGYLSREDLKVAVVAAFGYKPSKLEIDMMMAGAVENNLPGCGFLTLDDFKRAFADVTPHLPEQTVTEAFREVDRDLDGHVSFKDFEIVMRHE
ncbi:hypothetical protein chiPu_0016612 [Chiloscyllium punctatum]|uniref:EF-hand domain-containing protein n=1 Tax=Chiloscyllium punctatum TaxID=137246 RepID=A0A401T608_CHIPU|nr:hypothetical protein [Chiloscyllium punctatum]